MNRLDRHHSDDDIQLLFESAINAALHPDATDRQRAEALDQAVIYRLEITTRRATKAARTFAELGAA